MDHSLFIWNFFSALYNVWSKIYDCNPSDISFVLVTKITTTYQSLWIHYCSCFICVHLFSFWRRKMWQPIMFHWLLLINFNIIGSGMLLTDWWELSMSFISSSSFKLHYSCNSRAEIPTAETNYEDDIEKKIVLIKAHLIDASAWYVHILLIS